METRQGSSLRITPELSNPEKLEILFAEGGIALQYGELFTKSVPPKTHSFDFDRIEGMMLGLAIGDALGITTEGLTPARRRQKFGEIRDYIPNRYSTEAIGFPSDDTQLAFWTLDQITQDGRYIPEQVAKRFSEQRIFGIGRTVKGFLQNLNSGIPWYQAGPESAGNGAWMRIAPILIPHLQTGGRELWVETALLAMTTHNDPASTAVCLTWIAILWELLDLQTAPAADYWLDRYLEYAVSLEGLSLYQARNPRYKDYSGPIWKFTESVVTEASKQKRDTLSACERWYSGAYLLETIPCVLYILSQHASDPQEAMIRAVNDSKDNDTIAAIVGSAIGALYGKAAFPERWVTRLSGRTTDEDDGKIFEILQTAREQFWES